MDVYALTLRDASATLLSGVLAFGLVKSLETLAAQKALTTLECRKIVHMSTGPLFVLTWPLFRINCTLVCRFGTLFQWCEVDTDSQRGYAK